MDFFTSDWHLGETRITPKVNPFFRPFKSVEEQNRIIIDNCNAMVGKNVTLSHVGVVAYTSEAVALLDKINCK